MRKTVNSSGGLKKDAADSLYCMEKTIPRYSKVKSVILTPQEGLREEENMKETSAGFCWCFALGNRVYKGLLLSISWVSIILEYVL